MENTKEITFNTAFKENGNVDITYSGYLYKNGAQEITLVYGYGDSWDYTTEQKMIKTEAGFTTSLTVKEGYAKFNYCFKSSNNEWDNNFGNNFSENIEKATADFVSDEEINLLIEELDKFLNENVNEISEFEQTEDFSIPAVQEGDTDIEDFVENFDLDALIDSILNPVINASAGSFDKNISLAKQQENVSAKPAKLVEKYLISPRKLGKMYLFKKRVKLAFYKLSVAIPKLLFGESEN